MLMKQRPGFTLWRGRPKSLRRRRLELKIATLANIIQLALFCFLGPLIPMIARGSHAGLMR